MNHNLLKVINFNNHVFFVSINKINYKLWIKRNIASFINKTNIQYSFCYNCLGSGYISCYKCSEGCFYCDFSTIRKCNCCNGDGKGGSKFNYNCM